MSFAIEELKAIVDREYVGIRLDTDKVKPVHLANGLFRSLVGKMPNTQVLYRFVYHQTKKGVTFKGHDLGSVVSELKSRGGLHPSIDDLNVGKLRTSLKRLLSADDAVFTQQMQSYSAGHRAFLTRDTIGQSGGEFIASWLKATRSVLRDEILKALGSDDLLEMICKPLLGSEEEVERYEATVEVSELHCGQSMCGRKKHAMWKGMEAAASTLAKHLGGHPDKLFRLRMAVMFASLAILRHIALLEGYYDGRANEQPIPFLIDFGQRSGSRLSIAAKQSFARCTQSIARFYAKALGEELRKSFTAAQLSKLKTPSYKVDKKKRDDAAAGEIWRLKCAEALVSKEKFRVFGEATYDILARTSFKTSGLVIGMARELH